MNVLIIEDEEPTARRLAKMLSETDPSVCIMACTDSIESTAAWLSRNMAPDLIFMDIQLSDGLCFEIFELADITCPVIFTTAFDEYAIQAFKVNSIDYLLKPVKKEDLTRSLEKLRNIKNHFSADSRNIPLN
ncbi:MAG: LytR/AlgR family response regulator transcription factor, partial [Syntrophothermus sp.]